MFGMQTIVRDVHDLLSRSGKLKGSGMVTTVIALGLGALCLLGVLAFHYPQHLTTPDIRKMYPVELLRHLLFGALLTAGLMSVVNLVRGRHRSLNGLALGLVAVAVAWGGANVPVGELSDHTPYIGLDWFIVDLLLSGLIFVAIEKAVPLDKAKAVFRRAWQTDMAHFAMTHLFIGLSVVTVNFLIFNVLGWLQDDRVHAFVGGIPFVLQLFLCILAADLAEYWSHRAYHEVPLLWKFHSVHHSTETLDWLAGSRLHILEVVTTRIVVLTPLYLLGFNQAVLNTYIVIVGFWGVFIHANVRVPWGPLRYLVVTPDFHHWHHSSDDEAIDKNYATQFAFLDYLFGTSVKSEKQFPEKYGVLGNYMPDGFIRQQLFPFRRRRQAYELDVDTRCESVGLVAMSAAA